MSSILVKGLLLGNILCAENKYVNLRKFLEINEGHQLMINKMQEGFFGNLPSSKWDKIAKYSQDSAGRDIQDLLSKNVLFKEDGGGRITGYRLVW